MKSTLVDIFEHLKGVLDRDGYDAYKAEADSLLADFFESVDEKYRKRLKGVQFTVDVELSKYEDPIQKLNRMVEIFWEGVDEFSEALDNPGKIIDNRTRGESAEVRPLRPNK